MGNPLKIKYLNFYALFFLFCACSDNIEDVSLKTPALNTDELGFKIDKFQEFELQQNEVFQKEFEKIPEVYYDKIINDFVDKEMGTFTLIGELYHRMVDDEITRNLKWKLKIERYFRTTSLVNFIRIQVKGYTNEVNTQRKNGINRVIGLKHSKDLELAVSNPYALQVNESTISNIIKKIDTEIYDQLISVPLDGVVSVVTIFVLGFFIVVTTIWKKAVGCFSLILCFVFISFRSQQRSNEIKEELKREISIVLKDNKLNYLYELNSNTNKYYYDLQKKLDEIHK
jgi:ABC-type multidrug transport system fused ATPase/permease subunit